MTEICFCADDYASVFRNWSMVPRVGDTVVFPELGGNLRPLTVSHVVWEGDSEPDVTIYLKARRGSMWDVSTDGHASKDRI